LADARKTLGVEVGVTVGSSNSAAVVVLTGVEIEVLEIGVSSTGVRVDAGVAVGWDFGRLQAVSPRFRMRTAIQTRFLIDSSFSIRIVTGR
jgi:hypothetical protein